MKIWPASLPQYVERDGYRSGTGDGRLRSQTDAAIAKVRRRFSAIPRPLACAMKVTAAQRTILEAFIADDLAEGTLPFEFPKAGEAGSWIVQFGQNMPTWTALPGTRWLVTFDLVILP